MKFAIKQGIITLSLCILAACSTPGEAVNDADFAAEPVGRDCISQSTIRDYQVLDDGNLIVTAAVKRKYHVKLSRRAPGLRSTWEIGFRSPTGRVCAGTGELVFDDGFRMLEQIRVSSIRELSPEDVDDLLIQFGKKKGEVKQAPAPEEIEGAEVEELD